MKKPQTSKLPPIHAEPATQPAPIAMCGEVTLQAAAAGETGEPQSGPRPFSVHAYAGGALRVNRYSLPVVIDLKGLKYAKSITANLHHDQRLIVGHVTDKHNDGQTLSLDGLVSGTGPGAQELLANHAQGYPWQASVEAMPERLVEVPEGKSVVVNGQTFTGPIQIARQSRLYGIAFLPRGADENTTVSIAAGAAHTSPGTESAMKFKEWLEAMALELDSLTDQQQAALQKKYDAEIKAAAGGTGPAQLDDTNPPIVAAPAFNLDDIRAGHMELLNQIEAKLFEHEDLITDRKKRSEIRAGALEAAKNLKAQALKEQWAGPRYEIEALKCANKLEIELITAGSPRGPAIHSSNVDLSGEAIEAGISMALGRGTEVEKHYGEQALEAAHRHWRNISLQQLLIMAAAGNGYQCGAGQRIHAGNLREVLRFAFQPVHAAGPSTLSLPGIFSNVANKELEAGFMQNDSTWAKIAKVKPVNDFKQVTSYRLTDDMEYEQLAPGGKIRHGEVGEETYTRQAKTYAKMFTLKREDIINDDLGALDDLRSRLGYGAGRKFSNVFWLAFLNNASFFTTGLKNLKTGASTALGADGTGLQEGITLFRKLKTTSGKRLGGMPRLLLCPPELQFIAEKLYVSANMKGDADEGEANIHRGKYEPVVCNWLSDEDFAGSSTKAWYLLRNPEELASIVVSFLGGNQTPTVESADADFDTLGVQFRGYHDFGVDLAQPLAGVKLKGES